MTSMHQPVDPTTSELQSVDLMYALQWKLVYISANADAEANFATFERSGAPGVQLTIHFPKGGDGWVYEFEFPEGQFPDVLIKSTLGEIPPQGYLGVWDTNGEAGYFCVFAVTENGRTLREICDAFNRAENR